MKQMRALIKSLLVLTLIAFCPLDASALWRSELSLSTTLESNVLRSSIPYPDRITEGRVYVAHQWDFPAVTGLLSYQLNSVSFNDLTDHNYNINTLKVSGEHKFGDGEWLKGGLQASIREDREAYTMFDYSEFEGFVDARIACIDNLSAVTGYTLRKRLYSVVTELDNWEHLLYGGVTVAFSDGTTVSMLSEVGYKKYLLPVFSASGSGKSGGDAAEVGQWANTLRVSRPLLDNLGLMVYGRGRVNFGDQELYVSGLSPRYFSENDLYDDRYGYESRECGGMLSCRLPHALVLRIGYDYADKSYLQMPLDLDGNLILSEGARHDTISGIWGRAEKRFSFSGTKRQLNLYGEYKWLRNSSNDPFYRYSGSATAIGVAVIF
jgi:hypothetical protein